MADLEPELVVGGEKYKGWKSIRITQSIESLAGSFALDVSDRWDGTDDPWPIFEEDSCQVLIGGGVVIDGFVDKRILSAAGNSRTLTYTGRDRAAALVDNSAVLKQWTFRNVDLAQFATKLAAPFDIEIGTTGGLVLPPIPKIVVSPGEKIYEVLKKAADVAGVLLVSDGTGGVVLTRSGTDRAAALVESQNIKTCSVDYDSVERFRTYVLETQVAGTDEAAGAATSIQAKATDEGVRRLNRVLLIRSEKGYNTADARKRADWEARIRAARAETVTIGVQGWTQPDGSLWSVNEVTHVSAPRLLGVDGDLLISQVDFSIDDQGGRMTQLRLVRPDAFTPEPQKATVGEGGGLWKDIAKGAL